MTEQGEIKTMTLIKSTLAAAITVATLLPVSAAAQFKNEGYLVDQNFNIVTSSNTGLCWRTGAWTPALAVEQCDPDLVKKPAPAAKSTPVAPAPAAKPAAPKETAAAPKAPAKPAPQKINFSADALFDFDIVNGQYVGEDYLFCDRATQLGFKVYIDVDISLPHVGTEAFTNNFREEVVIPILENLRASRLKVANG